jgi:hypothetical protein
MSYNSLSTGIGIVGERYKHVNDAAATCRSLETQGSSRYHKRGLECSWLITVSCQKRPASGGTHTWIVRSWCRRSSGTLPRVSERWGKQQFREFAQRQVQAGKKNFIQARCPFHKSNASVWLPGSAGFQPAPEAGETPAVPGEGMNNWR